MGAIWDCGLANEWGRLLPNGVGKARPKCEQIAGTGTIFFVKRSDISKDGKITYGNFICDTRLHKRKIHCVRFTVGGDKLDAFDETSAPMIGLVDSKLHINSVISDAHKGARHLALDINNFYLGTPMDTSKYQYLRVSKTDVPQEIIDEYHPEFDDYGFCYLEIHKGMYGLKESGMTAYKHLVSNLKPIGYCPCDHTPGLWRHKTRPTTFTLCVDDFGVKYFNKDDAHHLINAININYRTTIDWDSTRYCGLTLKWN